MLSGEQGCLKHLWRVGTSVAVIGGSRSGFIIDFGKICPERVS